MFIIAKLLQLSCKCYTTAYYLNPFQALDGWAVTSKDWTDRNTFPPRLLFAVPNVVTFGTVHLPVKGHSANCNIAIVILLYNGSLQATGV